MRRHILFLTALASAPWIAYTVLFAGMIIEGDLLIFTAGFLVQRHILHPLDTFLAILLGVICGDSLWFLLGRTDTTRHKILHWLGRLTDVAGHRIDDHVKERTFRTLLITKFIYGAHHFTLVRAGRLGVPFRRFLRDDALGSAIWIGIIGALGYLTSASFITFRIRLGFLEATLLFAVLCYFLVSEIIARLLKKEL